MSVRLRLGLVLGLLIAILLGLVYAGVNSLRIQSEDVNEITGLGEVTGLSGRIAQLASNVAEQDGRVQAVQSSLQESIDDVARLGDSVRQFFSGSGEVGRTEFDIFLDDFDDQYPAVRSVQYAPFVSAFFRSRYEISLQEQGYTGFRIKEGDLNGQLITAGQRAEYFPIDYIVPFEDNEYVFGYDLASDPNRLAALNEARDTGTTTVTAPVSLIEENGAEQTVIIFTPIYRPGTDVSSVDNRRAALQGFAVIVLDIRRLIDQTAMTTGRGVEVISIEDITTEDTPLSLFTQDFDPESSTAEFNVRILNRTWRGTTTIPLNRSELLAEIPVVFAEISKRVVGLQAGDPSLGFVGISRHEDPAIIPTYNELVNLTNSLSANINVFLGALSGSQRTDIVPIITFNTDRLTERTEDLVALLSLEQNLQANSATDLEILLAAVAIVISGFGAVTLYGIFRRLNGLQTTARRLSQGELNARIAYPGEDEIGQIGQSLNTMASELTNVVGTLEERINVRTRDLQTVADVNTQISTILDPQRLLQDVADLTKERFGLYHSHVYLYDAESDSLVLMAGAGHVGRQMVSEGRSIDLDNQVSIVADAARRQRGVIINDVAMSETFLANPLLPDTKSELAVPLIARGQLLGVLDIQSDKVGFFTQETLEVINLLAGQIATALSNAQLYDIAERTSRHERALGAIDRRIQNAVDVDDILQTAVRELGKALRVPYTAIELQLEEDDHANGTGHE